MVCKGNEEWERCYVNVCVFRMCRTCIDYVNIDRELGLISNMKVSNGRNGSHVTFMKRKRERERERECVCVLAETESFWNHLCVCVCVCACG